MIIEVNYQTPKGVAADSPAQQVDFFECEEMPDKKIIEKKLTEAGKPFDKDTVSISLSKDYTDAEAMRRSGLRVMKI